MLHTNELIGGITSNKIKLTAIFRRGQQLMVDDRSFSRAQLFCKVAMVESGSPLIKYKELGLIRASYEVFKGEGELVLYCEHLQTVKYKNPADWVGKTEKA